MVEPHKKLFLSQKDLSRECQVGQPSSALYAPRMFDFVAVATCSIPPASSSMLMDDVFPEYE